MKNVVFSHYGTTLDTRKKGTASKPESWCPNVGLLSQPDFHVSRLHLFYSTLFHPGLESVLQDMKEVSPETEIVLEPYEDTNPWGFEENYARLYDYARSMKFDTQNESYYVHLATGTHTTQICLFLLTEARFFPAKLLETFPDKPYLAPGKIQIIDLNLSQYDLLASRFRRKSEEDVSYLKSGIQTRNPAFNAQIAQIERVAISSTEPILIMGPTGAGKSHLAHKIYELRHERQKLPGRFVEVNCATIRSDSAMSALFGHVTGAFTGASSKREGLLREANGGILFLDEIGELGLGEQAMLLHAIEYKTFFPLGSDRPVASDFQLLCGTNHDLRRAVSDGKFREDLLARINLWTFTLPGLVERPEDLEPNIDFELEQYSKRKNVQISFNTNARRRFLEFGTSEARWLGNFRDLNAAITRMATLSDEGRITLKNVEDEISRLRESWQPRDVNPVPTCRLTQDMNLDYFDRVQLEAVLRVCRESATLSEAGRRLFSVSLAERSSKNDSDRLRKYLKRFNLTWEDVKNG